MPTLKGPTKELEMLTRTLGDEINSMIAAGGLVEGTPQKIAYDFIKLHHEAAMLIYVDAYYKGFESGIIGGQGTYERHYNRRIQT